MAHICVDHQSSKDDVDEQQPPTKKQRLESMYVCMYICTFVNTF